MSPNKLRMMLQLWVKKGGKTRELNKGKEKQTSIPSRKRSVRRGSRTGIKINDDPPQVSD